MIKYYVLRQSVVIAYEDKLFTIADTDRRYARILEHIESGCLDDIPNECDKDEAFRKRGIDVRDGVLHIKDVQIDLLWKGED